MVFLVHIFVLFWVILAFFIPPKNDQAFIQGGTFIFDGPETVYAYYDASPGAHSDIDEVIDLLKKTQQSKNRQETASSGTTEDAR